MRYIGGKSLLTDNILNVIHDNTENVRSVTDIFSGSGAVAHALKSNGFSVTANDLLYFSYVINRGTLCNNRTTNKIHELIQYLNNLPTNQADPNNPLNFIANNYTPNNNCNRMYFQRDNALKIDIIRQEIENLLTDKVYEQAIGFLRITDGDNILDSTGIHPESYDVAIRLLEKLDMNLSNVGSDELINKLESININEFKETLGTDIYTLEDVIDSLKKPNRDPRDEMPQPILKSDILELKDLKVGMQLQGTVRNVVDFGAFVDIGLHEDGLVHISKITNKYIKHPSEVLSVGDIIDCYVEEIKVDKNKVSLTMIK